MGTLRMIEKTSEIMTKDIENAAGKLELMTFPKGMNFKVDIEVDSKIEKAVSKDPLLNQEMKDKVGAVYTDLVKRIGENLKNTDKGAITLRDTNQPAKLEKLVEVVNKGITGAVDVAKGAAEKAALEAWSKFVGVKKEYKDYKIKVGVKIAGAVSGLIVSITLFATGAVSFGASSIPGIIGMVKSVVTIGDEFRKLAQSIGDAQKELERNLKLVDENFLNAQGEFTKKGKAAEAGAILFKQFLGASLPCIKTCVENLGTVKSKHAGTIVKAHDAAKELHKILEKMEKFKIEFREGCKKKLEKHPSPLAKAQPDLIEKQLDEALAPMTAKVMETIEEVTKYDIRAKTFEPNIKAAEGRVQELVKLKGAGFKIFENVLVFSDIALSFADPGQYVKVGEACAGIIPSFANFAYDKIAKKALEHTFLE